MTVRYPATTISRILFETDPMNTCCQENDCFDEYDRTACEIAERIEQGKSLESALTEVISELFFDGQSFDTDRLDHALMQLKEYADDQ